MKNFSLFIAFSFLLSNGNSYAQQSDSSKINFPAFVSFALNGNIKQGLKVLNDVPDSFLIRKHFLIKQELIKRFGYENDESSFNANHKSSIDSLFLIFKSYWRNSLLHFNDNFDTTLKRNLISFFKINNAMHLTDSLIDNKIELTLKNYVTSKGLHCAAFSHTGKFYDLLVWKSEKDTSYNFILNNENITCPVIFMDDFVTLGWQEYATADKIHPGGWATTTSLYCVKKSYDLNSESFLISYLAHEGRHFNDYSKFPGLSNPDLEYRAKLTELSMANSTLFSLLQFFIFNSNSKSTDGHQLSNYYVIRDLSRKFFNKDLQENIDEWKKINPDLIRKTSYEILLENNATLAKNHNKYIPTKN